MKLSANCPSRDGVTVPAVDRATIVAGRPRFASIAAAIGIAALVGCGGTSTPPECSFFSNTCNPVIGPITIPSQPFAWVDPQRASAQVGETVVLQVIVSGVDQASYQWRRSADGGLTYVDIPGAAARMLTLAGLNLSDDGTLFQVDVRSNGSSVLKPAGGRLAVSSMPPVLFQDGDFATTDWVTNAIAVPAIAGPAASADHAASGGNPDAFRSMTYSLSAGASTLRVFNLASRTDYNPASQGAVKVIDFAEDCNVTRASTSIGFVKSYLLVEQGARRYVAKAQNACANSNAWHALPLVSSLAATDFVLADGPACTAAEPCPDFSATAAPLRLGYVREATQAAGSPAGEIAHGIDNWRVSVWRR
ncbi:hypothetical protein BH11PSE10_BH11PSE10_19130 [soil metagenome]